MQIAVQSGIFSKSSAATYQLRIRVNQLDAVAGVLGVISAAKQMTLERLDWQYPNDAQEHARLLARATSNGLIKAKAVAEALQQTLGSLLLAQESAFSAPVHEQSFAGRAPMMMARQRAEPADLGMQVQQHRRVKCEVRLAFGVSAAPV